VSPAPAGAARTDRAPVSQAPIGAGAPVGLLRPRRIPMASVGAHDSTPDDELVA